MIYTKYGMANIKREVPGRFIRKETLERIMERETLENEPFSFQRKIKVKAKVSKYNSEAGNLSL